MSDRRFTLPHGAHSGVNERNGLDRIENAQRPFILLINSIHLVTANLSPPDALRSARGEASLACGRRSSGFKLRYFPALHSSTNVAFPWKAVGSFVNLLQVLCLSYQKKEDFCALPKFEEARLSRLTRYPAVSPSR